MLSLDIEPINLRYKFLYYVQNVLSKCELFDIIDSAKIGRIPLNTRWAYSIKRTMNNIFNSEWEEDVKSKSSLTDYSSIKYTPSMETYLLDNIDFYGACLLVQDSLEYTTS